MQMSNPRSAIVRFARLSRKSLSSRPQTTSSLLQHPRSYSTTNPLYSSLSSSTSHLPRVAQPSFWTSLIPKPLRRNTNASPTTKKKEWNPATIFIVLGIVVGSNAINLIALRREMLNFSRRTEAKLALLREVIQKVKDGEPVDVKRALGTGDPVEEAEWEEVMRELESTDMLAEGRKKREAKRREKAEAREGPGKDSVDHDGQQRGPGQQRPKFLL